MVTEKTTQPDGLFTYWYSDDYTVAYSRDNRTGKTTVSYQNFDYRYGRANQELIDFLTSPQYAFTPMVVGEEQTRKYTFNGEYKPYTAEELLEMLNKRKGKK